MGVYFESIFYLRTSILYCALFIHVLHIFVQILRFMSCVSSLYSLSRVFSVVFYNFHSFLHCLNTSLDTWQLIKA